MWAVPGRNDWVVETENGLRIVIRCISAEGCRLIADAISGARVFGKNESIILAKQVAAELAKLGIEPADLPENGDLVAADIHCHTIYSDGLLTPLGLIAAAMYSQMDFLMIADHETADGVLDTVKLFEQYQWQFPLLCAEENSLPDGHLNSYPVTKSILPNLKFEELLAAAHEQGALVQYNHPATYSNRRDLQANGIANSGLEAWEHQPPPHSVNWSEQPAGVGSSDNHNTAFPTERTVTILDEITGQTFQNAVRRKQTAMLNADSEEFVYGPAAVRGAVLTALQDPERYLNVPRRERLQKYMLNSRISELYAKVPGATPVELGVE